MWAGLRWQQHQLRGLCVNTANDPAHCGGCDTVCPEMCINGGCALECGAATPCGQLCVDAHGPRCGGCGQACAQGGQCVAGRLRSRAKRAGHHQNTERPNSLQRVSDFSIHLTGVTLNAPATVTHIGVWTGGANNQAKCYTVAEARRGSGSNLGVQSVAAFPAGATEAGSSTPCSYRPVVTESAVIGTADPEQPVP